MQTLLCLRFDSAGLNLGSYRP